MTSPFRDLERSLRAGPPDELGYRPRQYEPPGTIATDSTARTVSLERVKSVRRVRRTQVTTSWHYLAAAVLIAVALAAVGIVGTSNRSNVDVPASARPTPGAIAIPPLTERFLSPRNGFSVGYPAGWTVQPATAAWPPDSFLLKGSPALDEIKGAGVARLLVASQALAIGQTEDDWLAAYFHPYQGAHPCGGDRSIWPRLPIDRESGYLDIADCSVPPDDRVSDRDVAFHAFVFSGGRVYDIGLDGNVDLGYFEAVLATMHLDPRQALD